ncbi:GGDEF domain-containing protein [Thalassomonas haliotis]|uniref:Diguanylate cyclase DosC n=2 Tax=Thalassomonas haliotis TaxID=485448 RepID=A0ABY7VCY4_9GAMM|nr:GGDEF domain-containing protein [Thalassomonas haliotis]
MDLLYLDQKSLNILLKQKPLIEMHVDDILDDFYKIQTALDEVNILIGDSETLRRLKIAQRQYVIELFAGEFDSTYINNRLRIGLVHKRIGVEPRLYLAAIRTIKELIVKILVKEHKGNNELNVMISTLDKVFHFDITLVFDTYIDGLIKEITIAKDRVETYAESLELKVAERTSQLQELTRRDPLTNIYNHRAMQDFLKRELTLACRKKTILSLVYFDVDHFKTINDKEGHLRGDEVLKSIGNILHTTVRETDLSCRYGGDEFCLLLPECSLKVAESICEKIIKKFQKIYPDYSLSIGIVQSCPEEPVDCKKLVQLADDKMYEAKQTPGNCVKS